jgi:hypothetical protein
MERIMSTAGLARRLNISRSALAKHIRRQLVTPDFKSDSGAYWRYESIQEAKRVIEQNRSREYKHLSAAEAS